MWGGAGDDSIWGDAGDDYADGEHGNDQLYGGVGNDTLFGGSGNDAIWGDDGNDTIYGENGADYLDGGNGADVLYGGAGNDALWGGAGNDKLFGDADNDQLSGEDGDDKLYGGAGSDALWGGAGSDFLDDGSGTEYVDGGAGVDFNAYKWAINGATYTDIYQGDDTNCGSMSAISAAAYSGMDLSKRIQYLGNHVYRVSLYTSPGVLSYFDVTFDGTRSTLEPRFNPNQEGEFWVIVLERAMNKSSASMAAPYNLDGMFKLTNRTSTNYFGTGAADRNRIIQALQKNQCAIVLHSGHWRTILGVSYNNATKQWEVQLRDPYGSDNLWTTGDPNDGLVTLSWAEFTGTRFQRYVIA